MNEATLEARINGEIAKHFSIINRLDITHQEIFTIKFGHSELTVGDKKGFDKFGRLDVLISYKKKPLAVLELKKPGIKLTDADRDQGISYARLLDKMAPIVILSNGSDVKVYNTIDKSEWQYERIDETIVKTLFENVSRCAANDTDEAIRVLLGKNHDVWSSLLKDFTIYEFNKIKGKIDDFRWPIIEGLSIERYVADEIIKLLYQPTQLLTLIGDPLSGKTNVIHQVCTNSKLENSFIPIYIDGSSVNLGIFETISNYLSRKFYYGISIMDIKGWMNFGVNDSNCPKLIIVIDSLSEFVSDNIKKDIDELVEISKFNNNVFIIISSDESSYEAFTKIPGRGNIKPIFRDFRLVKLSKLSDNEFNNALKYLKKEYFIEFYKGGNYNVDFRNPRILRMLIARLERAREDVPNKERYSGRIVYTYPSVTTGELLDDMWKKVVGNLQFKIDLMNYVKAYIKDKEERDKNPKLKIFSFRDGSTTYTTIQSELGENTSKRLLEQGILKQINGPNDLILYQPRVPELLSAAAAYHLAEKCYEIYKCEGVKKAVDYLVEESEPFPYGDLVGEHAVHLMFEKDNDIFVEFFNELIKREPYKLKRNETGSYAVKELNGDVQIHRMENEETTCICDLHPWLILSALACEKFKLIKGQVHPLLPLIYKIGSTNIILRRYSSFESNEMAGLHYHKVSNEEWVVCDKVGIVEPITFAMVLGLWREPDLMIKVGQMMEEDNNYILAFRLHLAASYLVDNILFKKSSKAAKEIINLTEKVLYSNLDHDIVKQTLKCNIKRNELCPCGTKLKYKKCCGKQ